MKTVIISGVTLILIIMSIVFANKYTISSVERIGELLEQVSKAVEAENWEEGKAAMDRAEQQWEKTQRSFSMLFHHDVVERIGIAMARLGAYVGQMDKTEAAAQLSIIEFSLKDIVKTDTFALENLL